MIMVEWDVRDTDFRFNHLTNLDELNVCFNYPKAFAHKRRVVEVGLHSTPMGLGLGE